MNAQRLNHVDVRTIVQNSSELVHDFMFIVLMFTGTALYSAVSKIEIFI